ncbi:MAG TPA: HAD family hydrolase [Solirubrobacteraceae bacterium]|nr:HAD family hydrolase [Solirubrobacteraceae bacterium]
MRIRAITFDLDDTLWPFAPVAARIETALRAWLTEQAPRTAARFDRDAAFALLIALRDELPELANRPGELRREALRRMLVASGDDPKLADPGLAVVLQARQQVDLYPEVTNAMDRLAARFPLLALTNGNADLELTGVAHWFCDIVSASRTGFGKPDTRIFHLACDRLGFAPAEVLHVGDNLEVDVAGALEAGMQAAWIHRELDGEAPPGALRFADVAALADALEDDRVLLSPR